MVKLNTFEKSYHNQLGAIIFLIWVSNPSFLIRSILTLDFVSVDLKLSEYGGTLHREVEAYSLGALVSDIGGALGLGFPYFSFWLCRQK